MKKIDWLILKSFVGPFIVTFFIALFVLIMQFLWKYIDDLVGKGLEMAIIAELMFYLSATMVPMALPIATLLSSIMTFGKLGENYELVAIKSSGISLFRFMAPLIVCAIGISGIAFSFNNYIAPVANLKSTTLLVSVTRQRPALNIRPGVYYDGIDNYIIRVGKKDPNSKIVHDIIVHDHSQNKGNSNVLLAESGEMYTTGDDSILVFKLINGVRYEDLTGNGAKKDQERPFQRINFKEYEMIFDLSAFEFDRKDEDVFKNNQKMLSVNQLMVGVDSMRLSEQKSGQAFLKNMIPYFELYKDTLFELPDQTTIEKKELEIADSLSQIIPYFTLTKNEKRTVVKRATSSARNVKSFTRVGRTHSKNNDKKINRYLIELHYKFSLSLACLILFLIGAPLGAIIRKGGLGTPMVLAIIFFVIFHILSTAGKKLAQEFILQPYQGMWMAIFILLPVGLFLTYKAMTDSALLNAETYTKLLKKLPFIKK